MTYRIVVWEFVPGHGECDQHSSPTAESACAAFSGRPTETNMGAAISSRG
jgi:hypothetical protein